MRPRLVHLRGPLRGQLRPPMAGAVVDLSFDCQVVLGAGQHDRAHGAAPLLRLVRRWKSCAYQTQALSAGELLTLHAAVRLFADQPRSFVQMASKSAFRRVPHSAVYEYSKFFGLRIVASTSLLDLLCAFCSELCSMSDEEALAIVHKEDHEGWLQARGDGGVA